MMNTNDSGVLLRKRRMVALRLAIGFPETTPASNTLAFAAVDQPSDAIFMGIAHKSIAERQDTLLHAYESIATKEPLLTVLVLRTKDGAEMLPVDLVEVDAARPLQFVTADRTRCFMLDERCQMIEARVPPVSKLRKGLRAGRARYEHILANKFGNEVCWRPQIVGCGNTRADVAA